MTHDELARRLIVLTGQLRTTSYSSDLDTARRALANSLLGGLPVGTLPTHHVVPPEAQERAIDALARDVLSTARRGSSFAFIRTAPISTALDPSTPAWARGMRTQTLGPFDQDTGIAVWVELVRATRIATVQFGAGAAFGRVPISQDAVVVDGEIAIGPGSVWIASTLLAPTTPPGAWTGFLIKAGGTLKAGGITVVDGQLVILDAECTLTASLDPAAPPPSNLTGPGVDASRATVDLPAEITIRITETAATITALSNFGATLYGQPVTIAFASATPLYSDPAKEIFVPGTPSLGADGVFDVTNVGSDVFQLSGRATVTSAAWALPVAETTIDKLGEAEGAGGVAMSFGPGIAGAWIGAPTGIPFGFLVLQASPGLIGLVGLLDGPGQHTYQLWDERPLESGRVPASTLDFAPGKGSRLNYATAVTGAGGSEQLVAGGTVIAHTDRPVGVDGRRLPFKSAGEITITETADGLFLVVTAPTTVDPDGVMALALENAVALVLSPSGLLLFVALEGARAIRGFLRTFFELRQLLPILPDPYVASFDKAIQTPGVLIAQVGWDSPPDPRLTVDVQVATLTHPEPIVAAVVEPTFELVDVSSHVDQLGVSWSPKGPADIVAQQLALAGTGQVLSLFTLSEISWEPLFSADPIPFPAADGSPSGVNVASIALTPILPKPLLDAQIAAVQAGAAVTIGTALPFGLIAVIGNPGGQTTATVSAFALNRPEFSPGAGPLTGGLQVTIAPPNPAAPDALFPGATEVAGPYGEAVLSKDVATILEAQFGIRGGVPLKRYDLSGYGASVFSEWSNFAADGPAIVKAQFNVFVGRTAHEVVQAQSVLYPWGIKVVRTIVIDRRSGGGVARLDSGWQAATPGLFRFPLLTLLQTPGLIHAGPVDGVFNIRRIRDNGSLITVDGVLYAPVLFDGDFRLDARNTIVAGGFGGGFTVSHDIDGYMQLGPFHAEPLPHGAPGQTINVATPVTRAQLGSLLRQRGPIGGPVSCTVDVGSAGQQMIATRVDVNGAFDVNSLAFVVPALRGAPVLPRDGSWSVGLKKSGPFDQFSAPVAIDPHVAVPLVQSNDDPQTWHFAEPADILNLANPSQLTVRYGLLQSTGTQKMFFARPQVPQAGSVPSPVLRIPDAPHLADVGALLNATGLFPDLSAALQFPAPQELGLAGEGNFRIAPPPFKITAPAKTLVDFNVVQLVLDYHDRDGNATTCTVTIDPAANPRWAITLDRVSLLLVSPFGNQSDPILSVVGTVHADANSAPTLKDLRVVYGGILSLVQEIFSRLQELAKFLPGGQKVAGLQVSFSDGKLTIRDRFALPTLPLGLGEISDVSLDLGASIQLAPKSMTFTAGIASPEKPFHWLVSLLSGTGCIQVGFQDDKPTLLIQAGLGVGLEINVAIASGSASIVIALQVDNAVSPFEVKAILTGQASVDVLDGLASASITMSAGLAIVPVITNPPEITLIGSVGVGIHISICWVVDVDFDGYWQFSQTLTSPVSVPLP